MLISHPSNTTSMSTTLAARHAPTDPTELSLAADADHRLQEQQKPVQKQPSWAAPDRHAAPRKTPTPLPARAEGRPLIASSNGDT